MLSKVSDVYIYRYRNILVPVYELHNKKASVKCSRCVTHLAVPLKLKLTFLPLPKLDIFLISRHVLYNPCNLYIQILRSICLRKLDQRVMIRAKCTSRFSTKPTQSLISNESLKLVFDFMTNVLENNYELCNFLMILNS